jgi:hypothetical protein
VFEPNNTTKEEEERRLFAIVPLSENGQLWSFVVD